MPMARFPGKFVELHADLSADAGRALAAEADDFVAAVSEYLGVQPAAPRVYVFRNGWNLWLYLRRQCTPFSERTGACFEATDGRLTVAVAADEGGRPAQSSLRHELTHAVIAANFAPFVPPMPWVDEGLAQVFESGCPPGQDPDRAARLATLAPTFERRLVRLAGIAEHDQLTEDDYLVAWGFTRFLLHDKAYGIRAIRTCLEPPAPGEGILSRFVRCLGAPPRQLAGPFAKRVRSLGAR